jgi:membrane protein insertase Oxa1/YidC/SpoIIIJ
MKGVSLGETQNLANYQKSTSNQQLSKIYKMNKLQQKVDALEKRLAVRDEELEGLNQETEELSRQRDESVK